MNRLGKSVHNADAVQTPLMPNEYPFWICQYGHTFADRSYHEISYKSDVTRIEYVLAGGGVINSRNQSCIVNAGDTYILHQGDNHNYYSDAKNPMDKVWVNVTGPLVKEIMEVYRLDCTLLFKGVDSSPYIYRMHEICTSAQDPYEIQEKVSGVFCELIYFLAKQHTDSLNDGDFLDNMRAYIDLHIQDNLSVKDLCEFSQKSPNQTIRLFKSKFGSTPYQYILKLKLQVARTMLRTSNLSVKKIAEQLGYCSMGHFSDIFYQYNGMRPSEYRNMYRSAEQTGSRTDAESRGR